VDAEVGIDAGVGMSWREEVGAQLRAQREQRGLSVEDVAERLKLRTSFVAAVEDGRGTEHMDGTYEWSHIKAIAGMLGIELKARG
jgi:cytoskeleton protein RodZ